MTNPAAQASGTLTATVGTSPESLTTINVVGTFILEVDLANMADADVVHIIEKHKPLASGTARIVNEYHFYDLQPTGKKVFLSLEPIPNTNVTDSDAVEYQLNQEAGTARSFPWKVYKYV